MPSPESNRRNSRKSTGPRTAEGKAVSRFNALWHGGRAQILLLPDENASHFLRFQKAFLRRFQPRGPEEQFLVNRMLLAAWRLHRLTAMEARVITHHALHGDGRVEAFALIRRVVLGKEGAEKFERETAASHPSDAPVDPLALAFICDSENSQTLVKLYRWQSTLERSYYRAFERLRQLRANSNS
jgi:hypothetical protein